MWQTQFLFHSSIFLSSFRHFLKPVHATHTHTHTMFLMDILCFHKRHVHSSHRQAFNLTHRRTPVYVCVFLHYRLVIHTLSLHLFLLSLTLRLFTLWHPTPPLSVHAFFLFLFSHSAFQLFLFITETQSTSPGCEVINNVSGVYVL